MKSLTVLIACGGTGGHLFPGIAVAEELIQRGHRPILLISEKKVDEEASAKYGHLTFKRIPAIAKPSTFSPKMIPFLYRLWKTIQSCQRILKKEQVDVVLGMGGFTSFPPVYAGHKMGLKTYVHDSNAIPGRSNLLTGKFCDAILLGWEAARSYFPKKRTLITGTPVRKELSEDLGKEESRQALGLPLEVPLVFVFGGSQGAQRLNTLVMETAESCPDVHWLHVTGSSDFERIKGLSSSLENHHVLQFCANMRAAYGASDLVICRSGASSMTELAYLGIPSLLVPYPYAADDHQTKNAQVFEGAGAGVLLREKDLNGALLKAEVERCLESKEHLQGMKEASRQLSVDDAAVQISLILEEGVVKDPKS